MEGPNAEPPEVGRGAGSAPLYAYRSRTPSAGILIQATRLEARVLATAELVTTGNSPVLFVSSGSRTQAGLLERALPGRGVLFLERNVDPAEWDLRLAEVAAGVHALIMVDARLLWDSQLVVALMRLGPRLVAFDLAPGGEEDSGDRWAIALRIARVRQMFPGVSLEAIGVPTSQRTRDWLVARLGLTSARLHEDLVPAGVALQVVRVASERDRWGAVLDAALPSGGPLLLVAPSRARAIAVAKRLGSTASAYHGGLLPSERTAILEAYRRRQPSALVVTQTLPRTDDLPSPAAIVLTHPPKDPEILVLLMGWAARGTAPVPLLVVFAPSDLAAARTGGLRPRPDLSDLREVYRVIRRVARRGYARVLPETLAPADGLLRGQASLAARGLNTLEVAGYVSRGDDVGRATTLTVLVTETASLVERGLPPLETGATPPVDPLAEALARGVDPIQWQRRAAAAALDGLLVYRVAGRERLYRLRDPVRAAASALRRDVRERVEGAADDARLIATWLQASGCRARALASAMGWPIPEPCGLCDACVPTPRRSVMRQDEPWRIALHALTEIPLAVPEGAAERIIRRALRRAGRPGDTTTTRAALARLRENNLVRIEAGAMQPRVVVTDEGRTLLTAGYPG